MTAPGICLAAGLSARMGAENKLLLPLDGASVLARSLQALAQSNLAELAVVVGHESGKVAAEAERALTGAGFAGKRLSWRIVPCADYDTGLSASLRAGLRAVNAGVTGALIALGDMPHIQPETLNRLLAGLSLGDFAAVPSYEGRWGNPVLLGAEAARAAHTLTGDKGARALLETERARVRLVSVPDEGILRDIDFPGDLPADTEQDPCD